MKCSSRALAALLAGLGLTAWAQVGDGPVRQISSPPTIYFSTSPVTTALPGPVTAPRVAPRAPTFAAGSVANTVPLSTDGREERRFLREAAAQSRFESEASKLAFGRSGNSAVRALAASLINHHNTLSLELTHLLNARGMALPMISNEQRKALNRLAKLHGNRLDAAYIQQVGLAQAGVARDYEKASVAIREPRINAWIVKTLPATRYHLMLAERAAPADLRAAKWNHSVARPTNVKAPSATTQVQPRALGNRPVVAAGPVRMEPVAGVADNRFSGFGTR